MNTVNLNEKQKLAYDRVLVAKAPITYLTGGAGTGKSTTAAAIIKDSFNVTVTATTHKAKTVLAEMLGKECHTIQKYLGYTIIQNNYKQHLHKAKSNDKIEPCNLLVVDEVSMLPNKILKEIVELVKEGKLFKQVLFIGDSVQLPAVTDKPNLKLIEFFNVNLTEQMRQDNCPTLINYFETLRNAIQLNNMPSSLLTKAPAITICDDHKEFCRHYLKCNGNKRILTYRNNVVDKYNKYINDSESTFNIGDKVVIDKPIASIGAHNKDTLTVHDIEEHQHYYKILLMNSNGRGAYINHYKLVSELNRQLEEFKSKHQETQYWDLFDTSFRLKHVFTSTVHAAQGDTIDYVFVDAFDIISAHQQAKTRYNQPISANMMLRLLYVAISRMKVHCYIYTGVKPRDYSELTKDPNRKLRTVKPKSKPIKERFTL